MTLDEGVREIHEAVEGARVVLLVGLDGMVVAGAPADGQRAWEATAAAHADLFQKVRSAQRAAELAPPEELVVGSASEFVVLRALTAEYVLVAVVAKDGSLGRARFEMRRRAPVLAEQL